MAHRFRDQRLAPPRRLPSVRLDLLMVRTSVVICLALAALGQSPGDPKTGEHRTTVSPLPGENILLPCEYRMALPGTATTVKAAWIIFDRGQDYLKWFEDRQVRAFARQRALALVLAAHCRSVEREDMIVEPRSGVGRSLFTALDQFAESTNRPELKAVGVIAMGWSGAGSLVARLAGYRPDRYLAAIAYAPGSYDPLGMDTIQLTAEAMAIPQLILANGGDKINGTARPHAYFRKYFEQGAPWTFVVQNRAPHCCLQNAQTIILEWIDAVLLSEPGQTRLKSFGFLKVELADLLDEWKNPVFNATASRISTRPTPKAGELPSGWMPSPEFAREWLSFTGRKLPLAIWPP